jgi:hypothetical protein
MGQDQAKMPSLPNVPSQSIAADKFAVERAAAVERLIAVAKAAAPVPARANEAAVAFRSLGHMRAAEAVPALLDHLAFDPHGGRATRSGGPTFEVDLPTVYALCQIGVPSLDPLTKRVGDGDKEAAKYAAVVVRRVLGLELGKAYLNLKVAAEPDPVRAARIKRTLAGVGAVEAYWLEEPAGPQQGFPAK